jgi:hypothetical protein
MYNCCNTSASRWLDEFSLGNVYTVECLLRHIFAGLIFFDMLRFILEQCFIGKNAMSLCEVDDIVELIPARRVGLTTFFFNLDARHGSLT